MVHSELREWVIYGKVTSRIQVELGLQWQVQPISVLIKKLSSDCIYRIGRINLLQGVNSITLSLKSVIGHVLKAQAQVHSQVAQVAQVHRVQSQAVQVQSQAVQVQDQVAQALNQVAQVAQVHQALAQVRYQVVQAVQVHQVNL